MPKVLRTAGARAVTSVVGPRIALALLFLVGAFAVPRPVGSQPPAADTKPDAKTDAKAGAPQAGATDERTYESVVAGLDTPTGVAVQPETGHLFVAECGAGRIVRIVDGKVEPVVIGFPLDEYGKGPKYKIGPLSLAFLDKETLLSTDGGFADGADGVRAFTVPAIGQPPLTFEATKAKLGPLVGGDVPAEGNLFGIAVTKTAIYVGCHGDDAKGWIAHGSVDGAKFGELKRHIATKEAVSANAPGAIAVSSPNVLAVGQIGALDGTRDSLLSFYHAGAGKLLLNQKLELYDVVGLAYGPSRQLYALDFAWSRPAEGGLHRLIARFDDGRQTTQVQRLATLDKPTALAFGKDGELYVTLLGTSSDAEPRSGRVVKFATGL